MNVAAKKHNDGVPWFTIQNVMHAAVLHQMMRDHITDYMHCKVKKED